MEKNKVTVVLVSPGHTTEHFQGQKETSVGDTNKRTDAAEKASSGLSGKKALVAVDERHFSGCVRVRTSLEE